MTGLPDPLGEAEKDIILTTLATFLSTPDFTVKLSYLQFDESTSRRLLMKYGVNSADKNVDSVTSAYDLPNTDTDVLSISDIELTDIELSAVSKTLKIKVSIPQAPGSTQDLNTIVTSVQKKAKSIVNNLSFTSALAELSPFLANAVVKGVQTTTPVTEYPPTSSPTTYYDNLLTYKYTVGFTIGCVFFCCFVVGFGCYRFRAKKMRENPNFSMLDHSLSIFGLDR